VLDLAAHMGAQLGVEMRYEPATSSQHRARNPPWEPADGRHSRQVSLHP
jgi:hypothetical protein